MRSQHVDIFIFDQCIKVAKFAMVGDTIQLDGQREGPLLKVLEKLLYTDET